MTWLVFDIGTTGTKAAVMTAEGEVLASTYREYETQQPCSGCVEQNATDWWQAVLDTSKDLHVTDLSAIAITGQMQNLLLLTDDAQPVRPVILYSDMRAQAEAAKPQQLQAVPD